MYFSNAFALEVDAEATKRLKIISSKTLKVFTTFRVFVYPVVL
jgi:hypothetical protein